MLEKYIQQPITCFSNYPRNNLLEIDEVDQHNDDFPTAETVLVSLKNHHRHLSDSILSSSLQDFYNKNILTANASHEEQSQ